MILCAILASCNILSYLTNLYIMYDMSTLPVVPVNMRPHKSSFNISPGFCIESFILRIISQRFVLQRKPSSFTVSTSAPFLSRINVFHSLAWLNFCILIFTDRKQNAGIVHINRNKDTCTLCWLEPCCGSFN